MLRPSVPRLVAALLVVLASARLGTPVEAQEEPPAAGVDTADRTHDLPLEPADTLTFTTDEGTWISLDVFPDGERLVFELLGDLYTLPLAGGRATRLTEGMGYDSQPSISPDGTRIAFVSDRDGADNVWVVRADGTGPRKLTDHRSDRVVSPSWTPDGDYVIVSEGGGRGVPTFRMYHVDGGSGVPIGAGGEEGDGGPGDDDAVTGLGAVAGPDGRYLYFARPRERSSRAATLDRWQIARLDLRTGTVNELTQGEGSGMRPVLSPDGSKLVYATRHETETGLRIRDLETGDDEWLAWPVQHDRMSSSVPSRDLFPGYAFTPDGREVLVTRDGGIHRVDVETGEVTEVPFTAEVELAIGPELEFPYRLDRGPVRATLIQDPVPSPDGGRVAFSALTGIYVMDVETPEAGAGPAEAPAEARADSATDAAKEGVEQGPRPLPHSEPRRLNARDDWQFKPTWSPDGEWIAWVTWDGSGGHVWKQRADGSGEPRRLTADPAFYTDIVFSPDGERIVGLRGNEYRRQRTFSEFGGLRIPLELVWLPAEGGEVRVVTPARGLRSPHFAGEPDRILVYSRDGLVSLRYDGTDERTLLEVTAPPRLGPDRSEPADRVLMSPTGRRALAAVNDQLWVLAVPPATGGEAPEVSVRSPSVPARRITDIGADYFAWGGGGETITWAIGSTFFRRPLSTVSFRDEEEGDDATDDASAEETAAEDAEEDGAAEGPETSAGEEREEHVPRDRDPAVEAAEVVLEFPRARPDGTMALRHATVITMAEGADGPVIEDADVVVTDDRIAAVGPAGEVPIPDGARVFDAAGTYVVPGFVDTHAHWEFRTHDVLEPHNWSLAANLAYGVTTGLDVQTSTQDYFAYRDLVATGRSIGQRALMTGPGVFRNTDFRSYEQALDYLRRYEHHYRTRNVKSYLVGNREQRQWIVRAARELELIPTTEGGGDMRLDVTHAIDGMHGNEHSLPVVPLARDVVELYARTRTAYTPTLLVDYAGPPGREYFFTRTDPHANEKLRRFYPHNRLDEMARRRPVWLRDDEFTFDEVAASAAEIQRAGGLVGVGGHGEVQGLGYHWEMWALAMGGMTPMEVLQAATIDGARIIGVQADVGSVEEGKLADLVVLEADPREDLHHTTRIRWVVKGGELYRGETLERLWPSPRDLRDFWWWDAGPGAPREGRGSGGAGRAGEP